jgi:hypothetical protein
MAVINFFEKYIQYWEHQAEAHVDIAHGPDGLGCFDVLPQDVLADEKFRGEMNPNTDYFLAVVTPSVSPDNEYVDKDGMYDILGGFMVLKKHSDREQQANEWRTAMIDTYQIGTELLQKVQMDSRNKHPMWLRSCDNMNDMKPHFMPKYRMGVNENYSGWLVTYRFKSYIQMICAPNILFNARFTDGGLTPF